MTERLNAAPQRWSGKGLSGRYLFIEVFAGSLRLSSALNKRGFIVHSWECSLDSKQNILRQGFKPFIRHIVSRFKILGLWMALPCNTFSRARHGKDGPRALRSSEQPWGLPGIEGKDSSKLQDANKLLCVCLWLCRYLCRANVGWVLENPGYSYLWDVPEIRRLSRRDNIAFDFLDFCQFGERWRKRTRLLYFNVPFLTDFQTLWGPSRYLWSD